MSTVCSVEDYAHHVNVSTSSILAATLSTQHLYHPKSHQEGHNGVDEIDRIFECVQYPTIVTRLDNDLLSLVVQPVWVIG